MRLVGSVLVLILAAVQPWTAFAQSMQHYLAGFPTLHQKEGLTCEAAAASMGTRGAVTEGQIMALIPRNPNPFLGFRGNPAGSSGGLANYGVYPPPIQRALAHYGYGSTVLYHVQDATLRSYINRGQPLVVWITYGMRREKPELAGAGPDRIVLVPFEHAILMTGYNATSVTGNDPWTTSVVHYKWTNFNRSWGYLGDMALAIDPCPLPAPITQLRFTGPSSSTAGAVWSWSPGAHDTSYRVRVVAAGGTVISDGPQTGTSYTLSDPQPPGVYQVTVWAKSACGDASTPVSTVSIVAAPATPTPTPTPTSLPPVAPPTLPGPTVTPIP